MIKEISKKEKQMLKGFAHSLKPVTIVGKNGLSDDVIKTLNKSLDDHELIKIKYLEASGVDRKKDSGELAEKVNANLIQIIGNNAVLYRYNPEKEDHIL